MSSLTVYPNSYDTSKSSFNGQPTLKMLIQVTKIQLMLDII